LPATSDVHAERTGATGHLVAVRLARQDGFDRVVMEFADQVPSYTVGYQPLPAQADASGEEIPLPGASAVVQVSLNPAQYPNRPPRRRGLLAQYSPHMSEDRAPSRTRTDTGRILSPDGGAFRDLPKRIPARRNRQ